MSDERVPIHPAARLTGMLVRMRGFNGTCFQAWAKAFEVPEGDALVVWRGLSNFDQLVNDLEGQINATPGITAPTFTRALQQTRHLYSMRNFDSGWAAYHGAVEQAIIGLEYLSGLQTLPEMESPISPSEIEKVSTELNALFTSLQESKDIPRDLKRLLMFLTDLMRRAIGDYHIFGINRVRDTFALVMVRLHTSPAFTRAKDEAKKEQEAEKPNVIGRFLKAIGLYEAIVKSGSETVHLLDQGRDFLETLK